MTNSAKKNLNKKDIGYKIWAFMIAFLLCHIFILPTLAYADCAGVETNIINCGEDASGGIYHLLSIVINHTFLEI